MTIGVFNPQDTTRTTSSRPADVLSTDNVRKWFSDALGTIPHAQDLNRLMAQFYSAGDYYGAADNEGDDSYLLKSLQTIVDNTEWTVSGNTGTADISAKRGLKGRITNSAATGITSFGTVQAGKIAIMYSATTGTPIRIQNSATVLTPNGLSLYLQTGDSILVVGLADGSAYRVYPLWALPSEATDNIAVNGDFELWPLGTSFSPAASTATFLAYGWKGRRTTNTAWTVSRQTGFNGARYCMRVQRTAADTATTALIVGYQIPSHIAQALAGKQATISFDLRCGTTMVTALGAGATLSTELRQGTGWDESQSLVNGVFTSAIAGAVAGSFAGGYTPSTAGIRVSLNPFVFDATATEAGLRIIFQPIATAAGASEYFEFTNFKIEQNGQSTPFYPEPIAKAQLRQFSRLQKSFLKDIAPAQNVGAGSGLRAPCTIAGAVAEFVTHVAFPVEMEATPAITLYNPAAANAQVRNITRSTDSTGAAAGNITTKGFDITCTGASGWVVGDTLEVHYLADAQL